MTDNKDHGKAGDVSHKRKFDEGEEQGAAKKTRLEELYEEERKLMARRAEIDKIEEDLIQAHEEAIRSIKAVHKTRYHNELKVIEASSSRNEEQQDVETMREMLQALIDEAKANPDKCFLFDHRVFHNQEPKWQPIRDLVNKELGGYYVASGYFGLEATEAQIACHWTYESLEWQAEQHDFYGNQEDNLLDIPTVRGQPGFYLNEIRDIELKNIKNDLDISYCQDLEWDDERPHEKDIDWDTDKSRVMVYGPVYVLLAIYTLHKEPAKYVYA